MEILLDPAASTSGQEQQTQAAKPAVVRSAKEVTVSVQDAAPAAPKAVPESAGQNAPPSSGLLQANVTFRRDSSGQIYYVVTDAATGKEIREVPSQTVRDAGEGIEEFLKQHAATPHLEVKG